MRTTRNAVLILAVLTTCVFGSDMLATNAYCADCGENGTVQTQCQQQQTQDLNDCCQAFGCNSSWSINYCAERAEDVHNGCVILGGCPNLVYGH